MSLLVIRLRDVIDRIKERMSRGEGIDEIAEVPAIPKDRLLEVIEDALMRADELRGEGLALPLELTIHLSTLRTLVERTRNYERIEREAALSCALALAILESTGEGLALEPYLKRLEGLVLEIAERAFE